MAKSKKIPAKIVHVCMTHDGRISSVLYDDGRVFLYPTRTSRWREIPDKDFERFVEIRDRRNNPETPDALMMCGNFVCSESPTKEE